MAYSNNTDSLLVMLPYLRPLLEGAPEVVWKVPAGEALNFAWRVRQALRIARAMAVVGQFQLQSVPIHGLQRKFRTEVVDHERVRAVEKIPLLDTIVVQSMPEVPPPPPKAFLDTLPVADENWLERITTAWQARSPFESRVHFSNAYLDAAKLMVLWKWAQDNKVLLFEHEGAITLLPLEGNEKLQELSWNPEDPT